MCYNNIIVDINHDYLTRVEQRFANPSNLYDDEEIYDIEIYFHTAAHERE